MNVIFGLLQNASTLAPSLLSRVREHVVGILVFLLVLGFMVLIHEAGHFFAAKLCGVRVEAFAIGFGKRLFGVVRNGTDYRINALPLGGYVKMAGQDEMPSSLEQSTTAGVPAGLEPYNEEIEKALGDESTSGPGGLPSSSGIGRGVDFTAVSRWRRMLIAVAGPVANFILTFLLLLAIGLFHYERAEYLQGAAILDYVPSGTPAAKAGLQPGDTLLSLDGQNNPTWQDVLERGMLNMRHSIPFEALHNGTRLSGQLYISAADEPGEMLDAVGLVPRAQEQPIGVRQVEPGTPAEKAGLAAGDQIVAFDGKSLHSIESLWSYLRDRDGKPTVLTVLRKGEEHRLTVTPEIGQVSASRKQYRLGFKPEPVPAQVVHLPFGAALKDATAQMAHNSLLFVEIVRGLFTQHVSVKNMSGPVGIEQQVSEAAKEGFWVVIGLSAMISLQLGIFNLLPMPILDGGLILFLLIESIARRDVKPVIKERVYQAAFVCIIVFFCFVMWNDISRIVFAHHPG